MLLDFGCYFFPVVLDVNCKVALAFDQKLVYFINWDVKDSVRISSDLWFLRGSTGRSLALEKVFYVLSLFAHEGFKVTHCLGQLDHWTRNILTIFDWLSRVGQVLNLVLDFLWIVSIVFITHFVFCFVIFITFDSDNLKAINYIR